MPKVDITPCAQRYHAEIQTAVQSSAAPVTLVGFVANDDVGAQRYAQWTERTCKRDGIAFDLRRVSRTELEDAVLDANEDPLVHGIIVYYPVFGGQADDYIRDVISIAKDVEGLNHRYRYSLYHNIRVLQDHGSRKCILPCTPLAIVKIIDHLGAYDRERPVGEQLAGQTAVVFNRSEVVGRPLAAMLANDGALVYSVDVSGMLIYRKGRVPGTIKCEETTLARDEVLAGAGIVVSGVPSADFCIDASLVKPGALAINFSQKNNFGEGIEEVATFVQAIGKVTIAMLERNLLRLHADWSRSANAPAAAASESPA